jgi:nucleoid-associated protein YgaU
VADLLTVPSVRRLLQGALGMGLVAASVASVPAPSRGPSGAAVQLVAAVPGGAATMRVVAADAQPAVMRVLDGSGTATAPPVGAIEGPERAWAWTVAPGDHLWSIATAALTDRWGRHPSDAEVDPYWRRLIEANRANLAHRDNPDLIYPGQVLVLPPVSEPPAPTTT